MFTNRELATAILLVVLAAVVLTYPKARGAVAPVLRAVLAPRLIVLWLTYLACACLIVWAAYALGAWTAAMAKDTVLLVFGVGLPMVFSAATVDDGRVLVRRVLRESVGVSALLAAYLQLASFSIPVEVLLLVLAAALAGIQVVAKRTPGSESVATIASVLLGGIGVAFVWRTTTYLATSWRLEDWSVTWRVLGMFVWYPVALVPFVYVVAYSMVCGVIVTHLRISNGMHGPPHRVRLAVVLGLHLSVRLAHGFPIRIRFQVARVTTFRDARAIMSEYREAARLEIEPKVNTA